MRPDKTVLFTVDRPPVQHGFDRDLLTALTELIRVSAGTASEYGVGQITEFIASPVRLVVPEEKS